MQSAFVFLLVMTFMTPDLSHGRLSEVITERFPVLVHNLHKANVDLKAVYQRLSLGVNSHLMPKHGELIPTAKGIQRVRLIQTYAGYEVMGPTAVAELNMEGHYTGHLYGELALDLHKDIPNPEGCVRDVKALLNIAIRLEKLNPDDPNIDKRDGRRAIHADTSKSKAKIIYVVEFFYKRNQFVSYPVYYMDACSNSVMFSFNKIRNISLPEYRTKYNSMGTEIRDLLLHTKQNVFKFKSERAGSKAGVPCDVSAAGVGGNENYGQMVYNTKPYCLPVAKVGFNCDMVGTYSTVVDNERSDVLDKKTPVTFDCNTGYRDAVNGAYGVANDAFFYAEMTGRFFTDVFNTRILNYNIRAVVHFDVDYDNAFSLNDDIYFGDGKDFFYPLTSLDVIAHEYGHAVTKKNSALVYLGQPGGINEAFSDVSAVAVCNYFLNTPKWSIGSEIMKSGKPLRYMDNPPKDGKSIKYAWRFRPFMNVHHSSGVFNFAFYHMVETFDMPVNVAYGAFLNSNRLLWGRYSRFRRGACNVVQAGYDTGADFKSMRKSFRKTFILLFGCNSQALKTTLFPGETRENILVSRDRSPILEVDMTHWSGYGVEVTSDDTKNGLPVRISLATDGEADHVIAEGENRIQFPANYTRLHVKLTTNRSQDLKVTLKVLN